MVRGRGGPGLEALRGVRPALGGAVPGESRDGRPLGTGPSPTNQGGNRDGHNSDREEEARAEGPQDVQASGPVLESVLELPLAQALSR